MTMSMSVSSVGMTGTKKANLPTPNELAARAKMEIEAKGAAIDSKYGTSTNSAKVEQALSQASANRMEFTYE